MAGNTGRQPSRNRPSRGTPRDRRLSGNGGNKPGPKPKKDEPPQQQGK